jgi:hypothetical protein
LKEEAHTTVGSRGTGATTPLSSKAVGARSAGLFNVYGKEAVNFARSAGFNGQFAVFAGQIPALTWV